MSSLSQSAVQFWPSTQPRCNCPRSIRHLKFNLVTIAYPRPFTKVTEWWALIFCTCALHPAFHSTATAGNRPHLSSIQPKLYAGFHAVQALAEIDLLQRCTQVRATHGAHQGTWYYEITVEPLGDTGHCRLGWSTNKGELQGPVGTTWPGIAEL